MLNLIVTFFLLAVAAALLGFGGLDGRLADIAKILTIPFTVGFITFFIYGTVINPRL